MDSVISEQDNFQKLEEYLKTIEARGLQELNSRDVLMFGSLYRRAVSSLSRARSQGVDNRRIEYLNGLVARSYGYIYTTEPKGYMSIITFFKSEFPQTFRKNLHFIVAAFIITIVAGLFAYGTVLRNPSKADIILGPGSQDMLEQIATRHQGNKNWMPAEQRPVMSSYIIVNNIKVCIIAFSTGILAGVGTCAILMYNGFMLGVVAAAVRSYGAHVTLGFWSFVAPHGVIELTAIFISGGAGLMLGWALLCPGRYTRLTALKVAGREAIVLMLGVGAMLIVAGTIEGYFSPSMTPNAVKLSFAAIVGFIEYYYLLTSGRQQTVSKSIR